MGGVEGDTLVRDLLEIAIVVAVGGTLYNAVQRLRRRQIEVVRCVACDRPTSRGYPRCKHCGLPQPGSV